MEFPLRVAAAPGTPSTPGAVEAPLVDAGAGTAESFAKLGARARGAIALVSNPEMKSFDDLFAEYMPSEIGRASCRERCRSRWSPYH